MNIFETYEYVRDLETLLAYNRYLHWINFEVCSYQWWLLTVVSILSVIVCIKLIDRKRLIEIFLYGLIIAVLSVTLDEFGYEYRLWSYNIHLLSQLPHISWVYYIIMPVIYMLVYQYYYDWRSYYLAMAVLAVVLAFVFEPLLVLMQIYVLLKWRHIYSFPIYFVIGVAAKALVQMLNKQYTSDLPQRQ